MDKTMHILVVDDNMENLRLVSGHLLEKGHKIALATSGEEALHLLEKTEFDLILLDIMMPGMDGIELCHRIKQCPDWMDLPIIFLTARDDTLDLVEGFKMGAADYITKPFVREELLVRVDNHLQLKLARDQLKRTASELRSSRNSYMRHLLELANYIETKR